MSNLPRNEDGSLQTYAWPGGYTIFYVTKDNSCLCPKCAAKQELENAQSLMTALVEGTKPWLLSSEIIIGADVNYEDCNLFCDNCNARIEPSYKTDDDCDCEDNDNS